MKKENGFIHIILFFLIMIIFFLTIYTCLDVLEIIDVPEEYSVADWIAKNTGGIVVEEIEATEETVSENIHREIEKKSDGETVYGKTNMPEIESGKTSGQSLSSYSDSQIPEYSYYYQLDDNAKIIYRELEKNLDNMKSGTYNVAFGKTFNELLHEENGEESLNNSFQLAINALNFDNPELFYLDISKIYLLTKITTKLWNTTYEVEIGASQGQSYLNETFASKAEVDVAMQNIENEKSRIKSILSGNQADKIKTIHDYFVDNLEYDSTVSKDNIYNIYGAMVNKCTVCEGYARAFKYLMDEIDVPCIIACGDAINSTGQSESHAWNYVQLNGNWYAIDVTWDDPVLIGNGRISPSSRYKYYLKGSVEFFENHTEDGKIVGDVNFKYPTLSTVSY